MQSNHQEQLETSHVPQETGFSFLCNYGVCQDILLTAKAY